MERLRDSQASDSLYNCPLEAGKWDNNSVIFDHFQILYNLFLAFPRGVFGKKYQNPRCMCPHKNPKEDVGLFNKPVVAGAVLQTPPSFTD